MSALKKSHFHGPYLPQNWSLPDSIIYFITMMPSNAKSYEKLVKCCKYFFSKNSICVADGLSLYPMNNLTLSKGVFPWFFITNLKVKLWITDIIGSYSSSLSPIYPKLYKTDFKELTLHDQTISYNDFLFISSNIVEIILTHVVVKNEDNTIVPLEKLVKVLPKIKDLFLIDNNVSSMITKNTVKELLIIPHFSKISKIILHDIAETFNIKTCFAFIKKNKITEFEIDFHFSAAAYAYPCAYRTGLEAIIDEILQTENHDYKIPHIYFFGLNFEKERKYHLLLSKN